jgi:hypothetical protein
VIPLLIMVFWHKYAFLSLEKLLQLNPIFSFLLLPPLSFSGTGSRVQSVRASVCGCAGFPGVSAAAWCLAGGSPTSRLLPPIHCLSLSSGFMEGALAQLPFLPPLYLLCDSPTRVVWPAVCSSLLWGRCGPMNGKGVGHTP